MLEVQKQGRVLKYVDAYFSENEKNVLKSKCDVCRYHNLYSLHSQENSSIIEYTMISDLTKSQDELWQSIHKTTKYDIRRSERYPVIYAEYDSKQIKNGDGFDWNHFSEMYEKMFLDKNLPRTIDKNEFTNEILCGGGYITTAKIYDVPVVYHYYLCDDKHVKLTISCSGVWSSDRQDEKNMIAYINKGLHWHDMLRFKEKGIESYDWGGVTWNEENKALDGINKFKISFGGEKASYYLETVIISNKARIYYALKKMINR